MRGVGIAVVGLLIWGCGGGTASRPAEEQTERFGKPTQPETGTETDDTAIQPNLEAKIREVFSRREPKVARCYSKRMEDKKLEQGEFTVKVQIRGGKAVQVNVTGKQWQDDQIQGCIEKLVGEWSFPEADEEIPFSYTYRFVPLT